MGLLVMGTAAVQAGPADKAAPAPEAKTPETAVVAAKPAAKVKGTLTKEEALQLMSTQYTIAIVENNYVQLVNRINERAEYLRVKYLKDKEREEYTFDPNAIRFVPIADVKKAQEEAKKANKTEIKLPEGVKFIDVSKDDSLAFQSLLYAVGQARSDLTQLYTKRTDMVNKLMKANNFKVEETDIDVMNGTFTEVVKEEAKKEEAKKDEPAKTP
jgi:hypothetical protein